MKLFQDVIRIAIILIVVILSTRAFMRVAAFIGELLGFGSLFTRLLEKIKGTK